MARHNAEVYGVEHRIAFRVGDARELEEEGDLLFLDPPWDDLELLSAFSRRPRWIKAPPSFPVPDGLEAEAWFGDAPGDYRRVKFLLLRTS